MTFSLVTSSVSPTASLTSYNLTTSAPLNETAAQAINIGNLDEESATISVSDQGANAGSPVSTTFTAQGGDVTSLSQSFGNEVDQAATDFRLYDNSGNIIADNQGSEAQQLAYTQWVAGALSLSGGTYTAVATPGIQDGTALAISSSQQQGTSLGVNSELTGGDSSEYYNFSLNGGNLKLAFDAGDDVSSTRVQILNSSGAIVADSDGNAYEKANYIAITSGQGLSATSGNYTAVVSYAPGASTTQNINYNFQLYSGTNYSVVYNNNVTAQPANYTAIGSVSPTSDAQLYTASAYNAIGEKAGGAANIGWLQENKSALSVLSQLTQADNADYYSFTLQSGTNLKFGFATSTLNPSNYRVQLLNTGGSEVIADSDGTAAQQAAYASLTTTNGLAATPGGYVVKVSYAKGVVPSSNDTYTFDVYSGTSYSALYKTTASAETYANALLTGNAGGGTTAAEAAASYLSAAANGGAPDIFSVIGESI